MWQWNEPPRTPSGEAMTTETRTIEIVARVKELVSAPMRRIKKVIGSKKGGAIRLFTPKPAHRIVMGEGIETTLTAAAHAFEFDTAYWAGVDLGNMAGRAARRPPRARAPSSRTCSSDPSAPPCATPRGSPPWPCWVVCSRRCSS